MPEMNYATWLTVASICALGAMSPGPSLAVVLRHALKGGRRDGSITAITHGLGIGLYALLCISGLAILITAHEGIYRGFQLAGAIYLIWLGIQGLRSKRPEITETGEPGAQTTGLGPARDGFLIVFLNPKVAVFFIALFSQVIGPETSWPERGLYAGTAWFIDTAWYLIVAFMVTHQRWLGTLQKHSVWFDRVFGVVLILLAGRLLLETLS
jgi:threonine/homoserine/homoserine lactone efflux protein